MMEESEHAQLTVPDILMPVLYYDGMRRGNTETQAIKRLMFAVLADAVRCFQTYAAAQSRAGRRMFGETQWWILDRNSDGPFTFEAICEALGIEPDCLRNGLHQWRVRQSGGMNPPRLGRRASVRSEGQISSPQRPQPRRRKGDIGGSDAIGNPSLVAYASRRGHLVDHSAPIEMYRDDPAMPSLIPDSASRLKSMNEKSAACTKPSCCPQERRLEKCRPLDSSRRTISSKTA
jgi:hypothetical protein